VTSAAETALEEQPPTLVYRGWAGLYIRVHLGGSLGHQCAEILEFVPWYGMESDAGRAHLSEPYKLVGERAGGRSENSARSGERRKADAAISPLVRAFELRLEAPYRSTAEPQVVLGFHACGSSASSEKLVEKRPAV
jgi:hypothetical protein